jgi:uncharacterized damage-inducible protein DinB
MTSPAELQTALTASRQRLLRAISGVGEEQFKRRPAAAGAEPGWCIAEVLAHLLASERLRAERIALALGRDGSPIVPLDPQAQQAEARTGRHAPVPQLIHGLLAVRREVEKLLQRAERIEGGLDRAVLHPTAGRQSVGWMIEAMIVQHEAEHAAQIEALREQVGAPPVQPV